MTSSHHAPYALGYTRTTMVGTKSSERANVSKSHKPSLSSDCRLQLACMKAESLVIAGQHTAVNTFPGLVHTARHTMEAGHARSRYLNPQGREAPKAGLVTGVKS
jgi:hypothetical protein